MTIKRFLLATSLTICFPAITAIGQERDVYLEALTNLYYAQLDTFKKTLTNDPSTNFLGVIDHSVVQPERSSLYDIIINTKFQIELIGNDGGLIRRRCRGKATIDFRNKQVLVTFAREWLTWGPRRETTYSFTKTFTDLAFYIPPFPHPIPSPSAQYIIPRRFFKECKSLADIEHKIIQALTRSGYKEISYYLVQEGFSIITRVEQINQDGSSKALPTRWNLDFHPIKNQTFIEYLKSLVFAQKGKFRIFLFWISNKPIYKTDNLMTWDQGLRLYKKGSNMLFPPTLEAPFTKEHNCTVLIYEFQKTDISKEVEILEVSNLSGSIHLEKSNIMNALGLRLKD